LLKSPFADTDIPFKSTGDLGEGMDDGNLYCGILVDSVAKLRKAILIFVMSVRLSVRPSLRMEKLGSHRMDFHEN
jgi:hypothetical protein